MNVTVAPLTGLLIASVPWLATAVRKGVRMVALCGVPPVAWIFAAVPAVILKELLVAELKPVASACNV